MTKTTFDTNFKNNYAALILAAGKGTRMHSSIPKVLQTILGEPMLRYVYDAAKTLCEGRIWTVVGHGAELVVKAFPDAQNNFILQKEQLGTGHALQVAWQSLVSQNISYLVVINGDTPLLPADKLLAFAEECAASKCDLGFMTLSLDDAKSFGRVVRKNGQVISIIEAKDYDPKKHGQEPNEINAGVYCLNMAKIAPLLSKLSNANKNGEFYITDLVALAVGAGLQVSGFDQGYCPELLGVNDPAELVEAEELIRAKIVEQFLRCGVMIRAASSVRISPDVKITAGASITGPAELYGKTSLGAGASIASHCVIIDSQISDHAKILSFTHMEGAIVGEGCSVGPYARLRPKAVLEQDAKVGNFVEIKKSVLHRGAKASHLSYIGDADVGEGANIGAGTITCNYDGKNKHLTKIGAGAFIGSNSALVAPVNIGAEATVGAGSVITKDIPDGCLGITRAKQAVLEYPRKK